MRFASGSLITVQVQRCQPLRLDTRGPISVVQQRIGQLTIDSKTKTKFKPVLHSDANGIFKTSIDSEGTPIVSDYVLSKNIVDC